MIKHPMKYETRQKSRKTGRDARVELHDTPRNTSTYGEGRPGLSQCGPQPAAPGMVLEMQSLRPYPRTTESESAFYQDCPVICVPVDIFDIGLYYYSSFQVLAPQGESCFPQVWEFPISFYLLPAVYTIDTIKHLL